MEPERKLENWLTEVQAAKTRQEVFTILDQFRALSWTDVERASMARLYMRVLEKLKDEPGSKTSSFDETSDQDEEVWYEKM